HRGCRLPLFPQISASAVTNSGARLRAQATSPIWPAVRIRRPGPDSTLHTTTSHTLTLRRQHGVNSSGAYCPIIAIYAVVRPRKRVMKLRPNFAANCCTPITDLSHRPTVLVPLKCNHPLAQPSDPFELALPS